MRFSSVGKRRIQSGIRWRMARPDDTDGTPAPSERGSRISRVALPSRRAHTGPAHPRPERCAVTMSAPRVLVVDDDRAVRESLRRALQLEDLEVGVAADGIEALAHIRRSPPDLLVLDVMMPGVDGLGVVRRLRLDRDDVPVLLLTAHNAQVVGILKGAMDAPIAGEQAVRTTAAGQCHQVVIGGIANDDRRDVRRILCDFSELGELPRELFSVGDAEPPPKPLLTGPLDETIKQLRGGDRRGVSNDRAHRLVACATRCDQCRQQHVGVDDDPQRQRP